MRPLARYYDISSLNLGHAEQRCVVTLYSNSGIGICTGISPADTPWTPRPIEHVKNLDFSGQDWAHFADLLFIQLFSALKAAESAISLRE
jgi:hypothetical protein